MQTFENQLTHYDIKEMSLKQDNILKSLDDKALLKQSKHFIQDEIYHLDYNDADIRVKLRKTIKLLIDWKNRPIIFNHESRWSEHENWILRIVIEIHNRQMKLFSQSNLTTI